MDRVRAASRRMAIRSLVGIVAGGVAVIGLMTAAHADRRGASQSDARFMAQKAQAAARSLGTVGHSISGVASADALVMFLRGDIDCNTKVDNDDLIYLDAYLLSGGAAPSCMRAADVNADGSVTTADRDFLEAFLSGSGAAPRPPFPFCGFVTVPLSCEASTCSDGDLVGFLRGDVDGNLTVDQGDVDYLEAYLFDSAAPPPCQRAADIDLDEQLTIIDWVLLTGYVGGGGGPLPLPFPTCGLDPAGVPATPLPCDADCCSPNQSENILFVRGDVDASGVIDSADAVAVYDFVFNYVSPACVKAADVNSDQTINVMDYVILLDFVGGGTQSLPAPFPDCGSESVATLFPCAVSACEQQPSSSVCECDCIGDPTCDGSCNVLDVVRTVSVAFGNLVAERDPNSACPYVSTTDVNCSGTTDVLDVVQMVNVAFRGAAALNEFCDPCKR